MYIGETGYEGWDGSYMAAMVGFCDRCDEPSVSIRAGNFLGSHKLFKDGSTP
jgi:hypothetical protein